MSKVLRLEWTLPDEVFGEECDEALSITQVKEEVVMRLLKERHISQGKASELLGVSRSDLFDLMAHYDISATDLSLEELAQEFAQAKVFFRGKRA